MPRELRISATLTLPEGAFEEAETLTLVRPVLTEFETSFARLGGAVEFDVVVPKPRAAKDELMTGRAA